MIRVVIADDHHLVRQGMRALLERAGDIEVVGEAQDGREAVKLAEQLHPDVLVMDIAMPRLSGIEAIAKVRALPRPTQVVILSMYSDGILVRRAMRSGARGYLLKNSGMDELHLAVRAASRGATYLSPEVSEAVLAGVSEAEAAAGEAETYDQLSSREREVLQLIAEGNTNAEVARALHVTVKTVQKHRVNLMSKLNVHDLAGLMREAIKRGLVILER